MGKGYISHPCTKRQPCIICGKTDHCFSGDYGQDGILHFCSKERAAEVFAGGERYILKQVTSGNYGAYESATQMEENKRRWMEEQRRTNPNWVEYGSRKRTSRPQKPIDVPKRKEWRVIDEIAPLKNSQLHQIYSYLLEMLVLEPEHKKALLSEWNAGIDPKLGEKILSKWTIKSLPMNDAARQCSRQQLNNPTRRELIDQLVKRFHSLRGVPGFYMGKDGRWKMSDISGIIYPVYDANGNIYRLRIGDEHPRIEEYAKDDAGNYLYECKNGKKTNIIKGTYSFDYRTGEWFFSPENGDKRIVWSNQKEIYEVKIGPKGYPEGIDGKIDGKYKNFSSRSDRKKETATEILAYNYYSEGTRSGSQISLYSKSGNDYRFVYVTEGEKKAMVLNEILGCPVIALPGVQTYSKLFEAEYQSDRSMVQFLMDQGMQFMIIVYDADKKVNETVLSSESNAVQMCKENGVSTLIGEWNPAFGKGADDMLIQGNRFQYIEK